MGLARRRSILIHSYNTTISRTSKYRFFSIYTAEKGEKKKRKQENQFTHLNACLQQVKKEAKACVTILVTACYFQYRKCHQWRNDFVANGSANYLLACYQTKLEIVQQGTGIRCYSLLYLGQGMKSIHSQLQCSNVVDKLNKK